MRAAYDLTPSPTVSQERRLAMQIGEWGVAATRANLLSVARRFDFGVDEASAELDRIKACVQTHWEQEVRKHGGTDADVSTIAPAFQYPGFESD